MSAIVQTLSCPVCQNVADFTSYESINVGENPALLAPLLHNELFTLSCKGCGHITPIAYDTLYHDPGCRLMVWLIHDEAELPPEPPTISCSNDYVLRRVFTSEELVEKAQLVVDGFDDRVMEMFKLILGTRIARGNPEMRGTIHYAGRSQENTPQLVFRIASESGTTGATAPLREFQEFAALHHDLPPEERKWMVIDQAWALRRMENPR